MLNKRKALLFILIILLLTTAVKAENFSGPEDFSQYIYNNYAQENFEEVYNNFAAELKRKMPLANYIDFQKQNFEKYNLKYSEIEVAEAKEIEYEEIKEKFSYAVDFGIYYKLEVSYLLEFNYFGSRDNKSQKMLYLRKIKDDFQIFWDYEAALDNNKSIDRDDSDD